MEKPPQEYPVDLKQRIKSGLGKLIMAISYGGAPYMGWIPRGSDFPAPPQQDYPSYEEEVFEYDECDWTPAIEYQEVEIMNLGMLALNKRLSVLDKRDRRALNSDVFNLDIIDTLAKKTEIKPTLSKD